MRLIIARIFGHQLRQFHKSSTRNAITVKMPSLSPTMTSGTIVKWAKKEGDSVEPGDVLCEVQTDKAVMALETDDEGTLAKIVVPENTPDVAVGTLIAMVAEADEDWKSVEIPSDSGAPAPAPSSGSSPSDSAEATPSSSTQDHGNQRQTKMIGPAVKLLLSKYGLKASEVNHTGPYGTLLKSDVVEHVNKSGAKKVSQSPKSADPSEKKTESKPPPPLVQSESGSFTDIPLSNMRKTIAKRLTQSKTTIPHAYASTEIVLDQLMKTRKELKADGVAVSVNDFIIQASAAALRAVPEVNVQISSDGETLRFMRDCDISVAVATEAGLITPIVKGADILPVTEISKKIKELAGRAKENKLQLHEFQGGSLTVSNLGMFGISEFSAIINPPQSAILAVGGSSSTLIDSSATESRMTVQLCYDSRAVGEVDAMRYLQALKGYLEDPHVMLLGDSPKMDIEMLL